MLGEPPLVNNNLLIINILQYMATPYFFWFPVVLAESAVVIEWLILLSLQVHLGWQVRKSRARSDGLIKI